MFGYKDEQGTSIERILIDVEWDLATVRMYRYEVNVDVGAHLAINFMFHFSVEWCLSQEFVVEWILYAVGQGTIITMDGLTLL